jgi:hypothetical protein
VTLAHIFGYFIMYLFVNKIKVFSALVNERAYNCGRFSIFVVWFLAYYYILLKVFWRLAFMHILWSYYYLSLLLFISYYTCIYNWNVLHVVCSCHLLKKKRLSIDNMGCKQYFVCLKWNSFSTCGRRSWNNHAFVGVLAPLGYIHLWEL